MKRRMEQFYSAFGDSGIMFILYTFSVILNCLLTWNMELPSKFPEEITVAGTAAYFSGKDWSELLGSINSSGGYIQAIFYVPLFFLFSTPYAIYKAMLVMNSLLISIIPLIVYHIAAKLGIERVRHKLMISLSCGMYVSYIACSKFVCSDTISAVLCWIMLLCVFCSWNKKNKGTHFVMSVVLGFLFAAAYAANPQLLAVDAAVLTAVLIAHFAFREKVLNLIVFAASCALSFTAEHFVFAALKQSLWNENVHIEFSRSVQNIFSSLYSGFYAFMTSSLGMGALALALFLALAFSILREGIRKRVDTPESNTRVYEPIKHRYSMRVTLFALFQLLAVFLLEIFSSLFAVVCSNGEKKEFESCADILAPFALFLVLVFIIQYGIELHHVLLGAGIYAYACLCFVLTVYGGLDDVGHNKVLSEILPLRRLVDVSSSKMTYLVVSSCVFTFYALLFVFISCTRKHRARLAATSIFAVFVASATYFSVAYIPSAGKENAQKNAAYTEVFALLYNTPQSPPIIIYEAEDELASTIQFLAQETSVGIVKSGEKIPQSCLLITKSDVQLPRDAGSYDNVGKTSSYTVYAFGETARNFIRYNSQAEQSGTRISSSS